jgi:hypothetical protein
MTNSEAQLVHAIKECIAKGDKAKQRAEDFYITAGEHLKTLKTQHDAAGGSWGEWEALVRDKVGIGKSRASELMMIADGTKTVEGIRAVTAERTRKSRESSPLRSGETRALAVVEQSYDNDTPKSDWSVEQADEYERELNAGAQTLARDFADSADPQLGKALRLYLNKHKNDWLWGAADELRKELFKAKRKPATTDEPTEADGDDEPADRQAAAIKALRYLADGGPMPSWTSKYIADGGSMPPKDPVADAKKFRKQDLLHHAGIAADYVKTWRTSDSENDDELSAAAKKAADAWGEIAAALGDEEDGVAYDGIIKNLVRSEKRRARDDAKNKAAIAKHVQVHQPAVDALVAALVKLDPNVARGVFEALAIRGPCGGWEGVNFTLAAPFGIALGDALADTQPQPTCKVDEVEAPVITADQVEAMQEAEAAADVGVVL